MYNGPEYVLKKENQGQNQETGARVESYPAWWGTRSGRGQAWEPWGHPDSLPLSDFWASDSVSLGLSFHTSQMGMGTPFLGKAQGELRAGEAPGCRLVALVAGSEGGPALPGHSGGDAWRNPSRPRWDLRWG